MNAPVIITKRPRMTRAKRVAVWDRYGPSCHLCGEAIGKGEPWEVEHVCPRALGGSDEIENLRPAHIDCHARKSATEATVIAKAVRVRAKHIGVVKCPKGRPMPGTRASGWKHKIGGGWEKRNG